MLARVLNGALDWLQRPLGWLLVSGHAGSLTPLAGVTQLSDTVVRVLACNPSPKTLQGTNTYLIGTGDKRVLVDTGSGGSAEYLDRLERVLADAGAQLQEIIVTHWHDDHIGGLGDVRARLGDVPARKFPRPEAADAPGLTSLSDGDVIETEGATLRVCHTPGHSTDHLVLQLAESGALFSGDCVLGETSAIFEEFTTYMASLQRLLEMAPTVIYPGHGPVVQDAQARIRQYISHRLEREAQLVAALAAAGRPCTARQLLSDVYTDIPFYMRPPALENVKHHLSKLVKDGAVIVTDRNRYLLHEGRVKQTSQ